MKTVLNGKTILPNIYTDETGSTKNIRIVKLYGLSYNNEASYYNTIFMYIPTFTSISTDQVSIKFNNADIGEVLLENQAMDAGKLYLIQFYEGEQYTGADNLTLTKLHAKVIKLSGSGGGSSIDGIDISGMFSATSTFANDRFNLDIMPINITDSNLYSYKLDVGIYTHVSSSSPVLDIPSSQDFILFVYPTNRSSDAHEQLLIETTYDMNCVYFRTVSVNSSDSEWKMLSGISSTSLGNVSLENFRLEGVYNEYALSDVTDKPPVPANISSNYTYNLKIYTLAYRKCRVQEFSYFDIDTNITYTYKRSASWSAFGHFGPFGTWVLVSSNTQGITYVPVNTQLILTDLDTGIYISDFSSFILKISTSGTPSFFETLDGRLTIVKKFNEAVNGDILGTFIEPTLNIKAIVKDTSSAEGWAIISGTTYAGTINFGYTPPTCSTTPTANNHLVNKAYVDGLVGNINTLLDQLNGEVI